MGDPVSVSVGWALWGKQPGAVREYSLLASSAEPLDEAEFANVLTHFMPGTPSAEPGSARPSSDIFLLFHVVLCRVSRAGVALGEGTAPAVVTGDGAAPAVPYHAPP